MHKLHPNIWLAPQAGEITNHKLSLQSSEYKNINGNAFPNQEWVGITLEGSEQDSHFCISRPAVPLADKLLLRDKEQMSWGWEHPL